MPSTLSPVNPALVRWAVAEDGRTVPELAEQLAVTETTLDEWMAGEAALTRGDVSKLADVLRRPRALFFLPAIPAGSSIPADFRMAPGAEKPVTAAARQKIREITRVQRALEWARLPSGVVDVPRSAVGDDPSAVAATLRTWSGLTDAERATWKSDGEALNAMRTRLADRGVLVVLTPIGHGELRGLSRWADYAPLIALHNSRVSAAARNYTLAHELAHLSSRRDSVCTDLTPAQFSQYEVERWCERVAANFLMPERDVRSLMNRLGITGPTADIDAVRQVMTAFRVSGRAAAARLGDLRLASPGLYARVLAVFQPRPPADRAKGFNRPRHETRLREYGGPAVSFILGSLPVVDALSVLRLTVADARKLAEVVPGVPHV